MFINKHLSSLYNQTFVCVMKIQIFVGNFSVAGSK